MSLISTLLQLPNPLVLGGAFAFMALVLIGGIIRTETSGALGTMVRSIGNFGLAIAFGVTLVQLGGAILGIPIVAGVAMAAEAGSQITLRGGETRVPLGSDGHYWVEAEINGMPQRFLIDTGATYTTISQDVAHSAGVEAGLNAHPVSLHTANGDTPAQIAAIDHLQVGNIVADDMQAIIAPDIGTTNVLGMNFLSGLDGWRVEGKVMILAPKKV